MFSSYFCFCERANFSVYWTSRGLISQFIGPPEGQFLGLLDSQRANFLVYWTTREPIPSFFEPLHRQRTARPLWRIAAGTPQGEQAGATGPLRGDWGGNRSHGQGPRLVPRSAHITPATSPPVGYTTNARGPGYAVHVQARVGPAGLGALPAPPLYCVERPRGPP